MSLRGIILRGVKDASILGVKSDLLQKLLASSAAKLVVKEYHNNIALYEKRKSRCSLCPFKSQDSRQCTVCGCLLSIKWKSLTNFDAELDQFVVTHCPKGFWNDADLARHYQQLKYR